MCVPNSLLFHRCQVYDKSPFTKKKYMADPVFNHCYILTSLFENTHIFAQIFSLKTIIVILFVNFVYRQQRGYIKSKNSILICKHFVQSSL